MSKQGTRLLLGLCRLVLQARRPQSAELQPRALSREEKKQAGLRYCNHPGYGCRWKRGRCVRDEREFATMLRVAD